MARMEESSTHDLRQPIETQDQELVDAALFEAAKEGDLHAAFIAIHKGADLSAPHDIRQEMALHAAAYAGHKDVVTFLLEVGANVNSPSRLGRTALHLAALSVQPQHRTEMATLLVAHGADCSIKDVDGKTARDYALQEGQFDIVDLLDQRDSAPKPMQPIPTSAIGTALAHAKASLRPKVPPASELEGVVRSV